LPPAADRVVAEMLTESIREAWEEAMPLQGDVSGTMHWMHAALQNQACEIENITEQKRRFSQDRSIPNQCLVGHHLEMVLEAVLLDRRR